MRLLEINELASVSFCADRSHATQGRVAYSRVSGAPNRCRGLWITQAAGDAGHGVQLYALGVRREQQEEDEVDRSLVDRVEADGSAKPREESERLSDRLHTCVRQCNAVAHSRRPEMLTLLQGDIDNLGVEVERRGGPPSELLQQGRLAADAQVHRHVVG